MRLDLYLHTNGYTDSRQKAKALISGGQVYVNGVQRTKASYEVQMDAAIEIRGEVMPYVGRGGYKLAGALQAFSIHANGFICADIGASTGGFTDCLLQQGAAKVFSIDSGSDQLAQKLRCDSRVVVMEQFNARDLESAHTNGTVDLCVCDVSFISLKYIFPPVTRILSSYDPARKSGSFVALVKPQFEAGRDSIGHGGIVRDKKAHLRVLSEIIEAAAAYQLYCTSVVPSPIVGGDGNREYLAHFAHNAPDAANRALNDRACLWNIVNSNTAQGD